jgi:hypothetical protein
MVAVRLSRGARHKENTMEVRKVLIGGALVGSTLLGGAVGATLLGTAGAQTPTTESSTTDDTTATDDSTVTDDSAVDAADDESTDADADGHHGHGGPHEANGITEAELTGDQLASATAAALAAEPGATVERAETDAEGAAFEVHVELADGSDVTIKLDADFNVVETVDGHG